MFLSFVQTAALVVIKVMYPVIRSIALFLTLASQVQADSIDDYIRAEMKEKRIPALALAVVNEGEVVKKEVYGLANVELKVPAKMDTSFVLASITKTFVSSAILQLVEAGEFSLDDSVTELLPDLPDPWAPVTVRHCLSHTSGLPNLRKGGYSFIAFTQEDILEELARMPIDPPGEKTNYNATNFMLLAMILGKVSGQDWKDYLKEQIFRPLGMHNTVFGDSREVIPGRASFYSNIEPSPDRFTPYEPNGKPVFAKDKIYTNALMYLPFYGGAGFNSSIADMVKWELGLASGKVLKPDTLQSSAIPTKLNNGKDGSIGLGWAVRTRRGYRVMEHGGAWATAFIRFLDHDLSVIVLTNLHGSRPEYIAMEVGTTYLPAPKNN